MTKNIRYLHFGERCHPIVIINMLLNINIKTLFQLGVYPFNTIVRILEDETFDDIMKPKYLRIMLTLPDGSNIVKYDELKVLKEDKINNYCHANTLLSNIKYDKMLLVHDYGCEEDTIVNYNFIQKSHKLKQKNFYEYIHSGDFLCFITILFDSTLANLEYERMSNVLSQKYGLKDFVIVIFTNEKNTIPNNLPKCFEIIFLKDEYRDDIWRSEEYRVALYKDMWEKFRLVMKKYNFDHSSFEEQFDINRMPRTSAGELHEASKKEQQFD
jgi:hypothetical protein